MTAPSRPARDPDLPGVAPAWKITVPEGLDDADKAPVGDSWLLCSPMSHPFWSWHFLAMVHLRDVPGQTQAPHRQFPEATHEILCFALDPRQPLPDPDHWDAGAEGIFLQPADFVVQFEVLDDEQALGVFDAVLRAAVKGTSVDSDLRRWWDESIKSTAQHYRQGVH